MTSPPPGRSAAGAAVAGAAANVDEAELARRRAAWTPPPPRFERGFGWIFSRHVLQADQGCDFDYLETQFGAPVGEPDIF